MQLKGDYSYLEKKNPSMFNLMCHQLCQQAVKLALQKHFLNPAFKTNKHRHNQNGREEKETKVYRFEEGFTVLSGEAESGKTLLNLPGSYEEHLTMCVSMIFSQYMLIYWSWFSITVCESLDLGKKHLASDVYIYLLENGHFSYYGH